MDRIEKSVNDQELKRIFVRRFIHSYLQNQSGLTSIEYGLIIMAMSLAIMAAYLLVGDGLKELMMHAASGIEHARSTIGEIE